MRIRSGTLIVLSLLLVSGLALSEPETATLTNLTGDAMAGDTPLAAGDTLVEGTGITLAADAQATITFADGSAMDVSGPAILKLVRMTPYMRRVDLSSGRINRLDVGEITTGVHTPWESFVALQNGSVSVDVDGYKVTYTLMEGDDAKVVDVSEESRGLTQLTTDEPIVIERTGVPGVGAMPSAEGDPDSLVLQVGARTVTLTPKDGFLVDATPTGGVRITCVLPEGQFGTVRIGEDLTFYLAKDDVIELDAGGNVVRSDAIVHSYAALDIRGIYDEAIANPGDSSPIRIR
jgi:hypothetical protein